MPRLLTRTIEKGSIPWKLAKQDAQLSKQTADLKESDRQNRVLRQKLEESWGNLVSKTCSHFNQSRLLPTTSEKLSCR